MIVSSELLRFIEWLFEHEQDALRTLIHRSLQSTPPAPPSAPSHYDADDIKEHMTQLLIILETIVQDVVQEDIAQQNIHHVFIPAIRHVDASQCPPEIIAKSIEKLPSSTRIKNAPEAKEIFCKALLKNWTPQSNKDTVN